MYVYAFLRHIFLFFFIPQHEDKDQVILVLQQQLAILHNKQKLRPRLSDFDRAFLVNLIKKFPNLKEYLIVVKPATILKWSKSLRIKLLNRKRKYLGGRPRLSKEVQKLIRELSEKNGWGIGKVYGELLYIGHKVSKSTIAKYMYRSENRIADRQSWRTFIRNSMGKTIAMDFFLVPTVNFKKVLYGFVVMSHDRRKILKIDVFLMFSRALFGIVKKGINT